MNNHTLPTVSGGSILGSAGKSPATATVSTAAERIVEASESLLNRLQMVHERLARVIARAAGPDREADGIPVPPRSEGLLYRAAEEVSQAHDVVSLINNQIDTIDDLI